MRAREPTFILARKCGSRRHSATSFSENVVLANTKYKCYSFYFFLRLGNSLISFNQDNNATFFGEKDVQSSYPGCLLFENTRKNFELNLVLLVVLALESKGLHLHTP